MNNERLNRLTKGGTRKNDVHAGVRSEREGYFGASKAQGMHSGSSIRHFREAYSMSQDTFTRLTGFSPRAVANWEKGRKPSASTGRRLTELDRLFAALGGLIAKEAIGPWLREPNGAFDGSTPLQVIERGELDRLWRMIYELESGEPG